MKRTSWIYCPQCHRDLNGDNESFVEEMGGTWLYKCATCGEFSEFDPTPPVPVLIKRFGRRT